MRRYRLNKYISIIIILLSVVMHSQTSKKETIHLLFKHASLTTCKISSEETLANIDGTENVLKFRKKVGRSGILFYICEESFKFDRIGTIDTCDVKNLKSIKFETLHTLETKRNAVQGKVFFKNSIFDKIYLVEVHGDKIVKYPVVWNTDLIQQ